MRSGFPSDLESQLASLVHLVGTLPRGHQRRPTIHVAVELVPFGPLPEFVRQAPEQVHDPDQSAKKLSRAAPCEDTEQPSVTGIPASV